jgi:hypothetical protein
MHSGIEYCLAGETDRVTHANAVQVGVVGIGTHLKIRFEPVPKTQANPYGQVGLKQLKVFGEPDGYSILNPQQHPSPIISNSNRVD